MNQSSVIGQIFTSTVLSALIVQLAVLPFAQAQTQAQALPSKAAIVGYQKSIGELARDEHLSFLDTDGKVIGQQKLWTQPRTTFYVLPDETQGKRAAIRFERMRSGGSEIKIKLTIHDFRTGPNPRALGRTSLTLAPGLNSESLKISLDRAMNQLVDQYETSLQSARSVKTRSLVLAAGTHLFVGDVKASSLSKTIYKVAVGAGVVCAVVTALVFTMFKIADRSRNSYFGVELLDWTWKFTGALTIGALVVGIIAWGFSKRASSSTAQ